MKGWEQLEILLNNYLNKQCTRQEIEYLLAHFDSPQNEEALKSAILRYLDKTDDDDTLDESQVEAITHQVHTDLIRRIREDKDEEVPVVRHLPWLKVAAAAVVLGVCSAGMYLYFQKNKSSSINSTQFTQSDVAAGGNKAVLTLADGSEIILDHAGNGELARQTGITVKKTADGQLVYTAAGQSGNIPAQIPYNTIKTPRGGQYRINLPDGTKVWLNAASSLRYPVIFSGTERKVELTGEAYFEVAKNEAMPFLVKSNNQVVEVLGTHFNISAYADEAAIKTTLVEGSVRVSVLSSSNSNTLKPGQASVLHNASDIIDIQRADIESVLAWKNGDFIFNGEDLQSIMRKVSRWYDVEVVYNSEPNGELKLSGWISRSKDLSAVLETMELTGKVHFKVEGRRITVMP